MAAQEERKEKKERHSFPFVIRGDTKETGEKVVGERKRLVERGERINWREKVKVQQQ